MQLADRMRGKKPGGVHYVAFRNADELEAADVLLRQDRAAKD